MATLGCRVTMIERSVVVAQLLSDALLRAQSHPDLAGAVERITLVVGDALRILPTLPAPDAIMLDPMFPDRRKQAMVKGEMQILQRFLGKDEDAMDLLQAAIDTGAKRVVLKRPMHDRDDLMLSPTYSIKGSAVRYDVYMGS